MKKGWFSKWVIVLSVIMIVSYLPYNYICSKYAIQPSPELTTGWFAFWALELYNLMKIRVKKLDHDSDNKETEDSDDDPEG